MVKKYTPETNCKKVPFELCGPAACPVEPGAEQCFDKTETVILFLICYLVNTSYNGTFFAMPLTQSVPFFNIFHGTQDLECL